MLLAQAKHDQLISFNEPIKQILPAALRYSDPNISELMLGKLSAIALGSVQSSFIVSDLAYLSDIYIWLSALKQNQLQTLNNEAPSLLLQHILARIYKNDYASLLLNQFSVSLATDYHHHKAKWHQRFDLGNNTNNMLLSSPDNILDVIAQASLQYDSHLGSMLMNETSVGNSLFDMFEFFEQLTINDEQYIIYAVKGTFVAFKPNDTYGFFILTNSKTSLRELGKSIMANY